LLYANFYKANSLGLALFLSVTEIKGKKSEVFSQKGLGSG